MNALAPINPAVIAPVEDVWRMAMAVAKSGLFGMKSPEEAMALMLIAQAEGQHPAVAARDYHIVDGRPTLKADAMLARFLAAGGKVKWHTYTDAEVKATFSHSSGGEITLDWTLERAKRITRKGKPITDGDNWRNYPRQMLRARTISEGVRSVYPGVAVGVYTPEEAQDLDEPKRVEVHDVTPPKAQAQRQALERHVEPVAPSRPLDRTADVVPIPRGPDAEDGEAWDAWRKVIAAKINRAATVEQVRAVQRANSEGLTACAEVLHDTLERMATLAEQKEAMLSADEREVA